MDKIIILKFGDTRIAHSLFCGSCCVGYSNCHWKYTCKLEISP